MNDKLHKQIYSSLNLKETDDLLEIWQTNDRAEWSDDAFQVIEEILRNRGEEIPEQNKPVYEHTEEVGNDENLGFSDLELKIIDDENPPDFYDPFDVLKAGKNLDYAAKAVVIVSLLSLIPEFLQLRESVSVLFNSTPFLAYFPIIISFILVILGVVLQIILTYYPLKAVAHILRILMEMEFNSRKAK